MITNKTLSKSEKIIKEYFCAGFAAEEISKRLRIPYFAVIEARYNIIKKGYKLPELKEEEI